MIELVRDVNSEVNNLLVTEGWGVGLEQFL